MNFEHWNSPGITLFLVEFDEVVVIGQAFAIAVEAELPWAGLAQGPLEFGAEANLPDAPSPSFAEALALKSVTAQEVWVPGLHVAETRHINAVGTPADDMAIFHAGEGSVSSAGLYMVHQVVAEFAAGVCQAIRELAGG